MLEPAPKLHSGIGQSKTILKSRAAYIVLGTRAPLLDNFISGLYEKIDKDIMWGNTPFLSY
jgi:hypothetical protein